MLPDEAAFRKHINGKETGLFILKQGAITVAITSYGARIVSLLVPDTQGRIVDVVTGFDSLDGYLQSTEPYHGTIVGRFANRIARGRFSLNGKQYQLAINNPPNHLHGGPKGFHNQVWDVLESGPSSLLLRYVSPDGEENYPGTLTTQLRYTLSPEGALSLEYEAQTDAPTVLNLTSHPFFNLNGQGTGSIEAHTLQIGAGRYNPVGPDLIPTGIAPVDGTPFDFREPAAIGSRIQEKNDQLDHGAGYDHNFVLDGSGFRRAGWAQGDRSGIRMEVHTDQPGMQLYSGNYMKSENRIKYGLLDAYRNAFCLETQHFPDSPNQPAFPSTVLNPGQTFRTRTVYAFSIP